MKSIHDLTPFISAANKIRCIKSISIGVFLFNINCAYVGHYLLGSSDNIGDQLSGEKQQICLATTGMGVETVKIKVLSRVPYNKTKKTSLPDQVCCIPFLLVIYGQEPLVPRPLFPAYLHMLCMLHMFCMKFYEFLIAQCS
jgi:hypothetical protein